MRERPPLAKGINLDSSTSFRSAAKPLILIASPDREDPRPALTRVAALAPRLEVDVVVLRVLEEKSSRSADQDLAECSDAIARTIELCDCAMRPGVNHYLVIASRGDFGQVTSQIARALVASLIIVPSGAPQAEAIAHRLAVDTGVGVVVARPALAPPAAGLGTRARTERLRFVWMFEGIEAVSLVVDE